LVGFGRIFSNSLAFLRVGFWPTPKDKAMAAPGAGGALRLDSAICALQGAGAKPRGLRQLFIVYDQLISAGRVGRMCNHLITPVGICQTPFGTGEQIPLKHGL
jgi:hypothetical protein